MNQPNSDNPSQAQDNVIRETTVGRDLVFAPVQIGTRIETQIVQISVAKVTQQPLIKASPYKGLDRFNFQDRDRFFGRDALIARLFEAVNRSNLSLVVGASGSGKSSVIRAGLIPELKKSIESQSLTFHNFIFTPHDDPFESFYLCLRNEQQDYKFSKSEAEMVLQAEANTLPEVIRTLKKENERWLIFVDQFEELFTNFPRADRVAEGSSEEYTPKQKDYQRKQDNFIEGLVRVANSGDDFVTIVLSMRADFLGQFSPYPDLAKIINQNNLHLVTDMHPDELRQAIEQPAAKHGVVFEEGLVEQIINDVKGQEGYLPLLQYTLNLLWETERNTIAADGCSHLEDRTLNRENYALLEGVRGALQKRVDGIYTQLEGEDPLASPKIQKVFVRLVNVVLTKSGTKWARRRANRGEFGGELHPIVQTFINENVLVSSDEKMRSGEVMLGEESSATVTIAHEILLSSWERLQGWIEEHEEAIILRNGLVEEVQRWLKIRRESEEKARAELLKGSKLEQVVQYRDNNAFQYIAPLNAEESDFIEASLSETERLQREKEARRRRDIRTAWIIAGISVVGVVISTVLGVSANNQQKQAELNQAESLARSSLSLLDEGKILEASLDAIRAGKILQKYKARDQEIIDALAVNYGKLSFLQGHQERVSSVGFSPDGKVLASGGIGIHDNTIKLWDVETGAEIRTLQRHQHYGLSSVSFSPDVKVLASWSTTSDIELWDLETGERIRTLQGHEDWVKSVSFSPDGKVLASGSEDTTIKLWNLETGAELRTLQGHQGDVWSVSFSPDGKVLASGSEDTTIKLWDLETGAELRTLQGEVRSVSFSPDGKVLASGSIDGTSKLWDLETGEPIRTLQGHQGDVWSVSFSPDGKVLASGSNDSTIKFWDLETGAELRTLQGHQESVNSVSFSFSPDGKVLASWGYDSTIQLWDVETEAEIRTLQESVNSVSFSPDGKVLASASEDTTIKLWNLETGAELRTLQGHQESVRSVSFSPDGKVLASGSIDSTIKLWDVETGEEIRTLEGWGEIVSFSPDGKVLASRDKLWDVETGEEIRTLEGGGKSVSVSPDGKVLASGGYEEIQLRDVETGEEIHTLQGHQNWVNSVSFSPDGKVLASGGYDSTIKLWDVETGAEIRTLQGHQYEVSSVSFSPDGKVLASGSRDSTIKLWDVETGAEIRTLQGHQEDVWSVSFSPDGKVLASGSADNTIKLWSEGYLKGFDQLMGESCDRIRNYLKQNSNVTAEDRKLCDGIGSE